MPLSDRAGSSVRWQFEVLPALSKPGQFFI